MIKYEFMRAHGKGSEGSEKKGGANIKKGCEKKGGVRSTRTPPEYATDIQVVDIGNVFSQIYK